MEYESRIHYLLPQCIAFNQSALRHFITRVHWATSYTRMSHRGAILDAARVGDSVIQLGQVSFLN